MIVVGNSERSGVGVGGIDKSVGICAGCGSLWILVGDGGGAACDFGLNISLQVVNAKRNGEGVTVRRGCFVGTESSCSKLSRPAEAGEGGDPDDNKLVKDFLEEAILLNFLP